MEYQTSDFNLLSRFVTRSHLEKWLVALKLARNPRILMSAAHFLVTAETSKDSRVLLCCRINDPKSNFSESDTFRAQTSVPGHGADGHDGHAVVFWGDECHVHDPCSCPSWGRAESLGVAPPAGAPWEVPLAIGTHIMGIYGNPILSPYSSSLRRSLRFMNSSSLRFMTSILYFLYWFH